MRPKRSMSSTTAFIHDLNMTHVQVPLSSYLNYCTTRTKYKYVTRIVSSLIAQQSHWNIKTSWLLTLFLLHLEKCHSTSTTKRGTIYIQRRQTTMLVPKNLKSCSIRMRTTSRQPKKNAFKILSVPHQIAQSSELVCGKRCTIGYSNFVINMDIAWSQTDLKGTCKTIYAVRTTAKYCICSYILFLVIHS